MGPYLESQDICAISSHHIQFPLPSPAGIELLPVIALRNPIDRARSVYDFERRQDADTPGAVKARSLSFADYVRWRMLPEASPTIRNFQCCFCTSSFDTPVNEQQYLEGVALLTRTPLLVIVERYDESMVLLEHHLRRHFPELDLSYVPQNVTAERADTPEQRVEAVYAELGPELTVELRENNHWDVKLYEDANALFSERLSAIGRLEELLAEFRSRCRRLSND
ncbi:MAG: hypothetical protein R3E50_00530 [Halioglobus sp.]